jgi:glycogen synthase
VHVLVTADTVGGVWTYTRELVCGLLERGHRVTLASFGAMPTAAQTAWMPDKNLAYYPTEFPLEWMQNSEAGIAESAKYLEALIANLKPDILHFSQFCYGSLDCGIPKIVVAHSDVRSWWKAVHEESPPQNSWFNWYTDLVSRGLSGADVVVAPSQWMLDALQENYAIPLHRTQVIHNGRNPDLFQPSEKKTKCVLTVGRVWDEAKQIKLLLDRTQRVLLKIAGTANHPENGCAFAAPSNANTTFHGEQDEAGLRSLYSDAAIYAATSRYEPFGLAPVEAALSRCALVVNNIPTFRELWGDAAFYFQQNDATSLAVAIRLLSEHSSLRSEYGTRAYQHALRHYAADKMVSEYENIYSSLGARSAAA